MVNLTIDGRAIQAPKGKTILEVADDNGIFIPRLCFHPALKPIGACRICVVEVKPGPPRPLPACATVVNEGMEVITTSERGQQSAGIDEAGAHQPCPGVPHLRQGRGVRAPGPDPCPGGGEGGPGGRQAAPQPDYESPLRGAPPGPLRHLRPLRPHLPGPGGGHGHQLHASGATSRELASGAVPLDCEFCGSCIDICPVGALINKTFKYRARAWEVTKTEMVCPFCGGGCHYELYTKNGRP